MSKKHLHNQAAIPLAPAVFKFSCFKLCATFECKAVHCHGDRRRNLHEGERPLEMLIVCASPCGLWSVNQLGPVHEAGIRLADSTIYKHALSERSRCSCVTECNSTPPLF
ncbi:hypothetical protein KGM_202984 [Danaus plexippus plexippus]|uniref:Uncharacterized protein n=1 Tax=Danaus plexippus plexippus TaxID=278856 RepID=A0A212EKG8_DANPL|nr:hypothetical protein KGM_202984 [Danaus plexippus plexippus]